MFRRVRSYDYYRQVWVGGPACVKKFKATVTGNGVMNDYQADFLSADCLEGNVTVWRVAGRIAYFGE